MKVVETAYQAQNVTPICQALSRLSPEVFSHPLWIHFDEFCTHLSPDLVHDVQLQTQEVFAKGELKSFCQLLLLCAALQKRLNDCPAAITCVQRAWTLAQLNDMPQVACWAAWGSSALYLEQGQFEEAGQQLKWLEIKLREGGDWVLANIVGVLERIISRQGKENTIVNIAKDWLVRWGESPQNIEKRHLKKRDRYHHLKDSGLSSSAQHTSNSWWEKTLNSIKRILRGKHRQKQIASDLSTPPIVIPLNGNDAAAARGNDGQPILSDIPNPSNHSHFERATFSLSKKRAPLAVQLPFQELSVEPEQPLMLVYMLDQFRVIQNDQLIENWKSRKAQSVFKYLVVHHRTPILKDVLMDIFWPDADPEAARRNLHQAIYALRQALKVKPLDVQFIQFENDCYKINPKINLWVDYEEFEEHVRAGQQHEQNQALEMSMQEYSLAESLYQNNFLAEDMYEDWPIARRQSLLQTYLLISLRLADYKLAHQEYSAAIAFCRRILSLESAQEEAHRILMHCYLAQGQRYLALGQYQNCVQLLKQELDLEPSEETKLLYQQIVRG